MATTNTEKYNRLVLTLVKGGTQISRALFVKCVNDCKQEGQVSMTVDEFLMHKKETILNCRTGKDKKYIIFPDNGGQTNLDKWDLYLFCFILEEVCVLPQEIKQDVKSLRKMRNKLCHLNEPALSEQEYGDKQEKLDVIFDRCLRVLGNPEFQKQIDTIVMTLRKGPMSLDDSVALMHQFYRMERQSCEILGEHREILDRHTQDHVDASEKMNIILGELQEISSKLPTDAAVDVPGIGVIIEVSNCSEDMEDKILTVLVRIFNDVIENKDSERIGELPNDVVDSIREAVENTFKNFLTAGKHIVSVVRKCVKLTIKCDTISAFIGLISDYNKSEISQQFTSIQTAINNLNGCESVYLDVIIYKEEFGKILDELVLQLKSYLSANETIQSQEQRTHDSSEEQRINKKATAGTNKIRIMIKPDLPQPGPIYEEQQIEDGMRNIQENLARGFSAPDVQLVARPTIEAITNRALASKSNLAANETVQLHKKYAHNLGAEPQTNREVTSQTNSTSIEIKSDLPRDETQPVPTYEMVRIEDGIVNTQEDFAKCSAAQNVQLVARPTTEMLEHQADVKEPTMPANRIRYKTFPCGVCSLSGNLSRLSAYCFYCDKHLCDSCLNEHINQSKKPHRLVLLDKNEQVSKLCAFCENNSPIKYCQICDEFLCRSCLPHPKPFDIGYISPQCCVCLLEGNVLNATDYCESCALCLCTKCADMHQNSNATELHRLVSVSDVRQLCNDVQNEYCDICVKTNGKQNIAIMTCKICREHLCEACVRIHQNQAATRNHTLFENETKTCQSCKDEHNSRVAEYCCKLCKTHNCNECRNKHFCQKVPIIPEQFDKVLCEPCQYRKKSETAKVFCHKCHEMLCDSCHVQHKAQKGTRDHQISDDISKYHALDIEKSSTEDPMSVLNVKDVPGKPIVHNVLSDAVTFAWENSDFHDEQNALYQVSYKKADEIKWKIVETKTSKQNATVNGLKSETEYVFRVRAVSPDGEGGQYSEESKIIKTLKSPAAKLVEKSTIFKLGKPSPTIYTLPLREVPNSRNTKYKTKKFELDIKHRKTTNIKEKNIMLVGATGTGKSTFVDGLVNYVLGVKWNDTFRFTILDLEEEEKARYKDQAISQTEWITVYTIDHEEGNIVDFRLNIIDTPGFGDTRGLERDQQIEEQIHALFTANGAKGVTSIDAICFLIKAPDARLTSSQKYIFQSIMALLGKDIKENICSLITFADNLDPPVLAALKASGLPFGKYFTFNNSGLFAKNAELDSSSLLPRFWDMGHASFQVFIEHLETMDTKPLVLTRHVLDGRRNLENNIRYLVPRLEKAYMKLDKLNDEIEIIEKHKLDAEANKDFEYVVEEVKLEKHKLPKGQYTTTCTHCKTTCHDNCVYQNNDDKANCLVMDNGGNCTQCEDKCSWQIHCNTAYKLVYVTVPKTKTYEDKRKKYQHAEGERLSHQQVVEKMKKDLREENKSIEKLTTEIKSNNDRLTETALHPNPLYLDDQLDMMIKTEQMERNPGHKDRLKALEKVKQKAMAQSKAENLSNQLKLHSKPEKHEMKFQRPSSLKSDAICWYSTILLISFFILVCIFKLQ